MSDLIRKAVELADGFKISASGLFLTPRGNMAEAQVMFDALAAQLVRQVDALGTHFVGTAPMGSTVYEIISSVSESKIMQAHGDDRTMNTIKAIVDAGVLE